MGLVKSSGVWRWPAANLHAAIAHTVHKITHIESRPIWLAEAIHGLALTALGKTLC